MAGKITPTPVWSDIDEIAETDVVKGGPDGKANSQAKALANRVEFLKQKLAARFPTFLTPEAGVDPVTGVPDGAYFNVISDDENFYADEYRNFGGVASPTGKRFLSSLGVQGQDKAASTIKDASGKSQQEINTITAPMVIRDTASTSWAGISSEDVNDDKSALLAELIATKKHVIIDTQVAINDTIESNTVGQVISGSPSGIILASSGMAQKEMITVRGYGSRICNLSMNNPLMLKSPTGGKQTAISVSAHDVVISDNRLNNMLHGVVVTPDGEWFNTRIKDNYILDCIGVGGGPSDLVSIYGEDRGDGIVSWGAGTIITGNYVSCKEGQDARIAIHCEGLNTYVPTPSAQDGKNFIMANNIVKGGFRRHLVFELCYNAIMDSNICWGGASWWNIALPEAYDTIVSNNVIYYDRTAANNAGGAWSPVRGVFAFLNASDSVDLNNNKVLFSGDAAGHVIILQNAAIHKHRNLGVSNLKVRSLKPAENTTEHGFLVYGDAPSDLNMERVSVKNSAYRAGFMGIYGAQIDNIKVENSEFEGVYEAVRTDNAANVILTNNMFTASTIKDNSTAGSNYALIGNKISTPNGFTGEPLYFWKTGSLDLVDNKFYGGFTSNFLGVGTMPPKLLTKGNVGADLSPIYTTEQLNNTSHTVNTYGKYAGKVVKTTSGSSISTGALAADVWVAL